MRDRRRRVASGLALPLLVGACASEAQPGNVVTAAPAVAQKANPKELAERLVRERVGAADALRFTAPDVFDSEGALVVCGRFALGGQGEQRYIVIGEEDVFIESQMEDGHMDRAAAEFCRTA